MNDRTAAKRVQRPELIGKNKSLLDLINLSVDTMTLDELADEQAILDNMKRHRPKERADDC